MKRILILCFLLSILLSCGKETITQLATIKLKVENKIYYAVLYQGYEYLFWADLLDPMYSELDYLEEGEAFYIEFEKTWVSTKHMGTYTPIKLIQDNTILYEK